MAGWLADGWTFFRRDHRKPQTSSFIIHWLIKRETGAMARDEEAAGERTNLLPASNGVDARKAYESGSTEASK